MATLAQYSAALHESPRDARRPAPGVATHWFGHAIRASIAGLVIVAAIQAAAGT